MLSHSSIYSLTLIVICAILLIIAQNILNKDELLRNKKIDKYFDNSKIIKSNSFSIDRELVSVVGESGSGKTTLLRCIAD